MMAAAKAKMQMIKNKIKEYKAQKAKKKLAEQEKLNQMKQIFV